MIFRLAAAVTALAAVLVAPLAWAQEEPTTPTRMEAGRLYREGTAARREGRLDKAIERLTQAAQIEPENADTQVQLGLALTGRRRYEEARNAFRKALNRAPGYDDARLGLTRTFLFEKRFDAAERELKVLVEHSPDNAEARGLHDQIAKARGAEIEIVQAKRRTAAEARRAREEAARIQAAAEAERQRLQKAQMLRRSGRFAEAEAIYRAMLQERPRDIDLLVSVGLVTTFQGASRFADARRDFERALALDPASVEAELGLVRIDLYEEALDAGERRVAEVLGAHPDNTDALALRGRIRLARGDPAGAEAIFRQLVARNPRDSEALLGLGDALRAELRDHEGRNAYALASAIDPTSSDIRNRLEAPIRPRWRLDLDGSYSHLTNGQKPWRESSLRIGYLLTPRTTLSGGVEVNNRFGKIDELIDGRIDHRWTGVFASYLRVGGTPHADFRPEFLVDGGGSVRLSKGSGVFGATLATLDLGFARYPTADITAVNPGLRQYLFEGRFSLMAQFIGTLSQNTDAETRTRQIQSGQFKGDTERLNGYLVSADLQATKRFRVFIGYADAPDASEGRVFKARSLFGGAELALDEQVSVRVSGSRTNRTNSYDRTTVDVGLTARY